MSKINSLYRKSLKKLTLLVILVVAIAVVTGCGSLFFGGGGGGTNGTGGPVLTPAGVVLFALLFPFGNPEFLAWRSSFLSPWTVLNTVGSTVNIEVEDSFDYVVICPPKNGMRYAYYGETTVGETNDATFDCDPTSDKTEYKISGNIDSALSLGFYFGRNFRTNGHFAGSGAYEYTAEIDNDSTTTGDFLIQAFTFGSWHYRVSRDVDISMNPKIDYIPDPGDSGETFSSDASSLVGMPGYLGLNVKFQATNLKVLFYEDDMHSTATFDRIPHKQSDPDDIYAIWAAKEVILPLGIQKSKIYQMYTNPDNLVFDKFAADLPEIGISSSSDFSLKVEYKAAYQHGLTGQNDTLVRVRAEKADIRWNMSVTANRLSGPLSLTFPVLDGLSGYDSAWNPAPEDVKRVTHYISNGDVSKLNNRFSNDTDASYNNYLLSTVQIKF